MKGVDVAGVSEHNGSATSAPHAYGLTTHQHPTLVRLFLSVTLSVCVTEAKQHQKQRGFLVRSETVVPGLALHLVSDCAPRDGSGL